MQEFDGVRAELYKQALQDYPQARKTDRDLMLEYLKPQKDEVVLEVGAGNGMFSGVLADSVKKLIVADPSQEQLAGVEELARDNIEIQHKPAEEIDLPKGSIDAIWSFGAVHHIHNKTKAFEKFAKILKQEGRLVIGDVFAGSRLAKHFDDKVAKYYATGHEVSFLSKTFAESLCELTGFERPIFHDFNASWKFEHKKDIGDFLYKLHAMTKTTSEECLKGAEEILGVEEKDGFWYLNWPMVILETSSKDIS